MRNLIKKVLFGKKRKKNYNRRYNDNNVKYWEINELRKTLNDTDTKLRNLMRHLKLESIGNSNLVGDKKDGKKFNGQWN